MACMVLNVESLITGAMAAGPDMTPGTLSFRLIGDVLIGVSAGKQIHALTRGGTARPPAGKYLVMRPIVHASLGRVAVVVPLPDTAVTAAPVSSVAPNALSGTFQPSAAGAAAGTVLGITVGVAPTAAKAGNTLGITMP